ncbi:MAG: patatin-like phospholipase family protein [Actinobacteria bacterium]|nr:patatin-like phospholipase family protein [Actinomycetota bacterium]
MARIGLVLGAGGIVGGAFHAGSVAALAEATGWDARDADVIVGTSAGSVVAASLRAGLPPADHLARITGGPLTAEGARLLRAAPPRPAASFDPRDLLAGARRPVAPHLALGALVRPGRVRPGAAIAGMLPAGRNPTESIGDGIRALYGSVRWPARPLEICAVRLRDGHLAVFGREAGLPEVDVGRAVEASCAIPGFFRPVRIGSDTFVDGGVHSPSNAGLLRDRGLDLAVVISPMSVAPAALRASLGTGRSLPALMLGREVRSLRRAGTTVLVVEPGVADTPVMGRNAMDPSRRTVVARQARESLLRRIGAAGPDVAGALEILGGAGTRVR